jgi:hypothetical protein
MVKPRYNEIERKIMAIGNYGYADRLKMDWAIKRFQKEFMKTLLGRFIKNFVEWLGRLCTNVLIKVLTITSVLTLYNVVCF